MTHEPSSVLRDTAFVRALLDIVIPRSADGRMPGAGSLGIEGTLADAIEGDARSGAAVASGLASIRDRAPDFASRPIPDRVAALEARLAEQPGLMPGLLRHLYPAYYQHPAVLIALGEPARPPFPEGFEVEPTDPDLLARLIARRGG